MTNATLSTASRGREGGGGFGALADVEGAAETVGRGAAAGAEEAAAGGDATGGDATGDGDVPPHANGKTAAASRDATGRTMRRVNA